LLRHKRCVSKLADMTDGTSFHRILDERDSQIKDRDVSRVVLCSGKVYFDILEQREARAIKDVKILTIEQLYPFPVKTLTKMLAKTPQAELVWCQEEPRNMGSWTFVRDYLEYCMQDAGMKAQRPIYIGRKEAASPATGSAGRHRAEQEAVVDGALATGQKSVAAE